MDLRGACRAASDVSERAFREFSGPPPVQFVYKSDAERRHSAAGKHAGRRTLANARHASRLLLPPVTDSAFLPVHNKPVTI